MNSQPLERFIQDLLASMESQIIQQPSMTHAIHSLADMQTLFVHKSHWIQKVLLQQLELADYDALRQIGYKLHQTYELNWQDVFELIDLAQNFCIANLPKTQLELPADNLLASINHIKNQLAYGYFTAQVSAFTDHFKHCYARPHASMALHKKWLIQLEKFFFNPKETPPEMEHSLCAFAQWLKTLEAKLTLHATGSQAFDLQAHILLAHRRVHSAARFVQIHLKQHAYIQALIHFENLVEAFLLLDKYITAAHFNYLTDPYRHFIDFVITESNQQSHLDYYFVIHYGLIEHAEMHYKHKKEVLDDFAQLFLEQLQLDQLDFISLVHKEKMHVVLNEQNRLQFDRKQPLYETLKRLQDKYGHTVIAPLRVNLFKPSHLPAYDFRQFSTLLTKMTQTKCRHSICEIEQRELQSFSDAVLQDLKLLDIIQDHLANKQFELHYQPIVDEHGHYQTLEALIRLPLEAQTLQAEKFLSIVEDHNLTLEVDRLVIALLQQDVAKLKTITPMVNVNIYPQSLRHGTFVEQLVQLSQVCRQHELKLTVEITEHEVLLHDDVLMKLHQEHHIQFAMDDFGSGYSNLAKLAEMASNQTVQIAKLDGSLIEGIDQDESKLNLVRFITDMADSLGLTPVIVEFVDSEQKLDVLKKLPATLLYQGFLFSKAEPLNTLLERNGQSQKP
jgi:EAL domain-containing protein (putative c-di-GMP-specific phosphodiesterase class I)